MDEIRIDNLKIYAYHGVFDEENSKGQHFFVNAKLRGDFRKAGRTDDLKYTVSYADVCADIERIMKERTRHLIEAAAEDIATDLLERYELLAEAEIEIRKPEAPIEAEFESVSVRIVRCRHFAYVAFGSNLGDSESLIKEGIRKLDQTEGCHVKAVSSIYRSSAYGVEDQPDFLNGVLFLETLYEPEELLDRLQEIEKEAGRERKVHWGPRTLDLDILFFDDRVIDTNRLTVPHPDMIRRDFVMIPLKELAPYQRHPLLGKTVRELCEDERQTHILSDQRDGRHL